MATSRAVSVARRRPRKPRNTVAEGYGAGHKKLRAELLEDLARRPGQPCPQDFPDGTRCGRPMYVTQALHLGHTADKRGYLGLTHQFCNDSAAQLWAQARRNGSVRMKIASPKVKGRRPW